MKPDMNGLSSPSSFRDPSGVIYFHGSELYRQVNVSYKVHYDHLMNSGLYDSLTKKNLLIEHTAVDIPPFNETISYKIIKPRFIPFISYPYEWCFSQLKSAALATLHILEESLSFGMILKDASAYNIQFINAKPVLIDSLSFELYKGGEPWIAYRQFCQHFLAPLALMSKTDIRLNQLFKVYIDGIPLDLTTSLLPASSRLNLQLLIHLFLHAKSQSNYADTKGKGKGDNSAKAARKVSKTALLGLIDSLKSVVNGLTWNPKGTEWGDYYNDTNYSVAALENKVHLVSQYLKSSQPATVWDLGANNGLFSRLASSNGFNTVSFDIDPAAVEQNYLDCVKTDASCLLPLILDLTNPSPAIGWNLSERDSILARGPADTVMALALIHHIAISNNVPLSNIAGFFKNICRYLIIEFVPKSDSQVQRLLKSRVDIFDNYTVEDFEEEFAKYFDIIKKNQVMESERVLYLMTVKSSDK